MRTLQTRAARPWVKPMLQHEPRRSGYVTQALINEHGSFRSALDALNAKAH